MQKTIHTAKKPVLDLQRQLLSSEEADLLNKSGCSGSELQTALEIRALFDGKIVAA